MANCINCGNEYAPKVEHQKYCSNKCRLEGFNRQKYQAQNPLNTYTNVPINEPFNGIITPDLLERILIEREAKHKAELEKLRAELKLESLESRVKKLEEEAEEEEPEQSIAGFKLSDIMQAYQMYNSMNTNTNVK